MQDIYATYYYRTQFSRDWYNNGNVISFDFEFSKNTKIQAIGVNFNQIKWPKLWRQSKTFDRNTLETIKIRPFKFRKNRTCKTGKNILNQKSYV